MENREVHCLLINNDSLVDVMYYQLFKKLQISRDKDLDGFSSHAITPLGYLKLRVTFRKYPLAKAIMVCFLVVSTMSLFNVLIERPTLNALGVVISTPHLTMKFFNDDLKVVVVRGD